MTSGSNIFIARTLKSILGSFLLTYVTTFALSLRSIFSLTFDFYTVLYAPIVLAAVSVFVLVALRKYVRTSVPCTNRFQEIVKGLSAQTLASTVLCSFSAVILSRLNPFSHNETVQILLNVGSAAAGVVFYYETIYFEQDFHFPTIQTTKYSMFMSKLSEILFKSMKKSLLYTFFISIPLYSIEPKLPSNAYLFMYLWFSVSLILYLFYSFEHIIYLFMTERVNFPIVTIKQDSDCLLKVLNNDRKIIRSLALHDLYKITIEDAERRKQIFSLSFAGNVPQSWKIIFNYCINNIKNTTKDLTTSVKHLSPKSSVYRPSIPKARLLKLDGHNHGPQHEDNLIKPNKLITFLEYFRIYNYFFEPLDKVKTFEELEVTVWCCYILSNLAVASLKEDEYGIVREQLGVIISTILDLKNQLELQRIHFDNKKVKKIKYLKIHVKTCCVMLALHFSVYANDIGLDETQLQSFKKIISALNNY